MKIFLFGGAEKGQATNLLKLIDQTIQKINFDQFLHIPFARTTTSDLEWQGDWFNRNIKINKEKYLNAENKDDVEKAISPLIFISGGSKSENLLKKLKSDPKLLKLVLNAEYIIAESAGAKILASKCRLTDDSGGNKITDGLDIIKNTIIEPHYSNKKRQKLLEEEMIQTNSQYGLGIDSETCLEIDTDTFPRDCTIFGNGTVEIKS